MKNYISLIGKPLLVFILGLFITAATTALVYDRLKIAERAAFKNQVITATQAIEEHLNVYTALLRATASLFAISDHISHEEFYSFTSQLYLEQDYPGMQGIGWSAFVKDPAQEKAIEQEMYNAGVTEFKIWPENNEAQRHTILYLAPQDERNKAALGFDMYSDPTRRAAMARARDAGEPAASGRVILVQEIEGEIQAGFLIYLPVYEKGVLPSDIQRRRENLRGFVYAPFRAGDFIKSAVEEQFNYIDYAIYSGLRPKPDHLLYRNTDKPFFTRKDLLAVRRINVAGTDWTLYFRPGKYFPARVDLHSWLLVFLTGLAISALLAWLSYRDMRSQKKLAESEELFRNVFDFQFQFMALLSPQGRVIDVNELPLKVTGVSREEVIGQYFWNTPWWDRLPEMKKNWPHRLDEAARSPEPVLSEDKFLNAAGDIRIAEAALTAVRDHGGQVQFYIIQATDITERKEYMTRLAESERAFRGTFENAAVGISNIAEGGRWLKVNQRLCDILGYSKAELEGGMTVYDVTYPPDLEIGAEEVRQINEGEIDTFDMQKRYCHKSGRIIWGHTTVSSQKDENGKPLYFIAVTEDITEKKNLELKLREENEQKNRFLATMAHELRNPLSPISNVFTLLERAPSMSVSERNDLVALGKRSLNHVVRLVDDLLDITRINQGKIKLQKEKLVIQDIVREGWEENKNLIEEKNHRVNIDKDEKENIIEGDRARLRQVFSNLINNAAKFTPAGGEIGIRCTQTDDLVRVDIIDNGPGLPAGGAAEIFDLFFQGPYTAERGDPGLGIGLALVKELVELHGGSISAQNRLPPEQGSIFSVTLPVAE